MADGPAAGLLHGSVPLVVLGGANSAPFLVRGWAARTRR
jgi:hypothetical protein